MNRTANKASRLPNGVRRPSASPPSPNGSNGDTPPASPPATDGRDPASGRFLPGWKGGPGNPFARRTAKLRLALLDVVDERRLRRIVRKLADLAEAGDVAACKVLLAYLIGKPAEVVDPDTLDQHELRLMLAETPSIRTLLTDVEDRIPADQAVQLVAGLLRDNPARIAGLLAAAQQKPARPRQLTEERLEQLLAAANMKTAGGHPGTTHEAFP
jgi:hypothetical protein